MLIARATQGFSALETGLQHLCPLASARRVDALLRQQVRAKAGQADRAQRGHHRIPIGQDHLKGGSANTTQAKESKDASAT